MSSESDIPMPIRILPSELASEWETFLLALGAQGIDVQGGVLILQTSGGMYVASSAFNKEMGRSLPANVGTVMGLVLGQSFSAAETEAALAVASEAAREVNQISGPLTFH